MNRSQRTHTTARDPNRAEEQSTAAWTKGRQQTKMHGQACNTDESEAGELTLGPRASKPSIFLQIQARTTPSPLVLSAVAFSEKQNGEMEALF
jgi:hypothetical protein